MSRRGANQQASALTCALRGEKRPDPGTKGNVRLGADLEARRTAFWRQGWRATAAVAVACGLALSGCASNSDTKSESSTTTSAVRRKRSKRSRRWFPGHQKVRQARRRCQPSLPAERVQGSSGKDHRFRRRSDGCRRDDPRADRRVPRSDFAKIIPSIQGGTFNVRMSSFTDNQERQQSVDFVDYFNAGSLGAAARARDRSEQCVRQEGRSPGHDRSGNRRASAKSKGVHRAGKPAINILKFDGQDAATNAVVLGQADAMSADSPVTAYAIKQSNGSSRPPARSSIPHRTGWPVAKGSPLTEPLSKALQHLIDNDDYKTIATNWGVESRMIEKPVINGGAG